MKQMCKEMTRKGQASENTLVSAAELWAVGRHISPPYPPGLSSTKQTMAQQPSILRPCLAPGAIPGQWKQSLWTPEFSVGYFVFHSHSVQDTAELSKLLRYEFWLWYVPTVRVSKQTNHWFASVSSFRRSLTSLSRWLRTYARQLAELIPLFLGEIFILDRTYRLTIKHSNGSHVESLHPDGCSILGGSRNYRW